MIRILIAEDQAMVRRGLKVMIETDEKMKVMGEAKNGKEAIELCEKQLFDVAILDIRMPEMNGLEAARVIRSRWPSCKVLMLTTFNDDDYALEALNLGASGYILKDGEPESLIQSIRSCLAGGLALEDHVAAKLMPRLLNKTETKASIPANITPRELDIMKRIGEGRTNKEIAGEFHISVGTVKNYVSQILDKLELRDRTQLAIYVIRNNLI